MLKENEKVRVHFMSHDLSSEIITRATGKVFTVIRNPQTKKLSIPWNSSEDPLSHSEERLSDIDSFVGTVIFESIDDGKKYRFDAVTQSIKELF